MQVMALLMSAQQTAPSAGSEGSSGNTFKLREKLNELLANLREEQRLESEHHHAIFREILSPLQVDSPFFFSCRADAIRNPRESVTGLASTKLIIKLLHCQIWQGAPSKVED